MCVWHRKRVSYLLDRRMGTYLSAEGLGRVQAPVDDLTDKIGEREGGGEVESVEVEG